MSQTFVPSLFYRDPAAALAWLERAFGFEISTLVTDDAGNVAHAEMSFRGGHITVGGEWESPELVGPAAMRSPASVDGRCTQFVRVTLESGLDDHCAVAEAAGARITQAPKTEFYGSRTYRALDPEGHVWSFDEAGPEVSIAEMERLSGLTVKTFP